MSRLGEFFGWTAGRSTSSSDLPNIFPMAIPSEQFVSADVFTIFSKILTDTLERCQGLSDDQIALMWDNCVKSNSSDGVVSLLAKAMAEKRELYLVYDKSVQVVRQATSNEAADIKADYSKQATSKVGVYISFKNYVRADMVRLYSALDYSTISALNKTMNLSKAIQIKINDMRASVSLADAADAEAQAMAMAQGLAKGHDVSMDAKDSIETAIPNVAPIKESISFIASKLAFYLGLPAAYLTGEQTGGLGTTGENDTKAVERGLKGYFFSILKPTIDALFGVKLSYKSQDFRQISGSMEVLKTFALIDEEFISVENKQKIVNSLLDLPPDAKGDPVKQQAQLPAPKPVVP